MNSGIITALAAVAGSLVGGHHVPRCQKIDSLVGGLTLWPWVHLWMFLNLIALPMAVSVR